MRFRVIVPCVAIPLSLMATGCLPTHSQYRVLSSGLIGCAPDQIQIVNDQMETGTVAWEATCNGRHYFCSAAGEMAWCKEPPATADTQATPTDTVASPAL